MGLVQLYWILLQKVKKNRFILVTIKKKLFRNVTDFREKEIFLILKSFFFIDRKRDLSET